LANKTDPTSSRRGQPNMGGSPVGRGSTKPNLSTEFWAKPVNPSRSVIGELLETCTEQPEDARAASYLGGAERELAEDEMSLIRELMGAAVAETPLWGP